MARPAFYCSQTLLGGKPDINRRTIYAEDTMAVIKVFNVEMKAWTLQMQAEVDRELKVLNDLAGVPRKGYLQ